MITRVPLTTFWRQPKKSSWCWICCLSSVVYERKNNFVEPCEMATRLLVPAEYQEKPRYCCSVPIPPECSENGCPFMIDYCLESFGIDKTRISINEIEQCLRDKFLVYVLYLQHAVVIIGMNRQFYLVVDPDMYYDKNQPKTKHVNSSTMIPKEFLSTWQNYTIQGIWML